MTRQTYGALCALAEQHGVKMTEEVRAFVRAVERADAAHVGHPKYVSNEHRAALFFMLKLTESVPLRDVIEATRTVQTLIDYYTRLASEYEVREDGKLMRKDRWETGFRNIATILQGPRGGFEIEEIVEKVRALKVADGHEADPAGAETAPIALQSAERQGAAPVPDIKAMVDDFLGWRMPDDFYPDCFVTFDRDRAAQSKSWPTGTNILSGAQAEAMFGHALGVSVEPAHGECPSPLDATEAAEREHMGCAHCRTGIYAQQHCINCGLNISPSCDCHRGRAARKAAEPIYQVVVGEDPGIWRDVTAAEYDQRQPSSRRKVHFAPKAAPKCWCYACNKDRMEDGFPYVMTRMIVCPSCGNKRCPRATDHNLACTDSNAPGQPGSRYGTALGQSAGER
jgi:hypothetical protein